MEEELLRLGNQSMDYRAQIDNLETQLTTAPTVGDTEIEVNLLTGKIEQVYGINQLKFID